ncbi:FAD-dependent monooxygenase [Devosia sp. ZW T5_3]|uniref:FAD-dependent monooxygenase n=1 Tax=Devosia sp. ZW T5_3 TaxID=3378085 RepID=UPI00385382CE
MIAASQASAKSGRPSVAIAGGGIGGLALALVLKKQGFDPVVFERKNEEQLRGEGLFLTLAPNGVNALRALGLAEMAIAAGVVTKGLAIHNEHGKRLALVDYAGHAERFGAPSITIGRGALSTVLLDAAQRQGIKLHLSGGIEAVAESADGVTVTSGGVTGHFDMLVACDGLRSTVRRLVFPDLPQPRYSGLIGTGGMADAPAVPGTDGIMNMTFGRRAFFGYLHQPGRPVMWFNSYPAPENAAAPIADPQAYARRLAAMHSEDPLDNRQVLASVTTLDRHYPIFDMPELQRWHSGRIVLMGDAAHAVAPHSGQGASMAIEDALVLAACLDQADEVEAAFRRFYRLRHERTQTAIRIGRMSGSQKHAQSWLQLRIRDLILPLIMPLGVRAQEKMFHFRADRDPLATPRQ